MKKILFAALVVFFAVFIFSKVGAQTSCSSSQYWNSSTNSCVTYTYTSGGSTTCPSGQTWNGTACVNSTTTTCPSGYYLSGTTCVVSTTTTSYSSCSSALQTLLGSGCHWMYTNTYCNTEMNKSANEGDTAITGTCASSSGSSYVYTSSSSSSTTTCPSGYYWNGTSCVVTTTSGTTGSTSASCTSGQYWNGSACVASTNVACSSGQYWNGSACVTPTYSTASASMTSPTGLAASGKAGNVTLYWGTTTGATKYVIYRKLEGSNWSYLTSVTTATYLDSAAIAGTHEYYVQACSDTGGCSPDAGLRVTVTADSVSSTTFTPSGSNYTYSSGSYTAPTNTYTANTSYAGDANSCPGFAYSRWDKAGKRYCQLNSEKRCDYNYPSYQTNGGNYVATNCPAEEVYTYTAQTSSACPSGISSLLGSGCHQMYTDSSGVPVYCDSDMKRSMKVGDTVANDGCAGSYYNAATYAYSGDANSCPGFAYSKWDKTGTRYCQLNAEKKCDYKYPSYTTNGSNYKAESCPTEESANTTTYVPPSSSCPSGVLSVLGTGCHQMYTDSDSKPIYCDSSMTRSMKASDTSAKSGCSYTYTGNANWVSHDWKFTDGTQNSFILNRTDSEYTTFIAGIDAQCAKISKNKFGWKTGAGNDSATNWQNFGVPDCSGTVTAATCPSGQYWNGASCVLTTITATCPSNYHYMSDYTGGSGGYCMSDDNSSTCQPLSGGATYTCGTKAIDTTTSQYKDWKKVDWGTGGSSYVPTTVTQTVIDATKAYISKNCPATTYYVYENSSDTNRPNPGVPSCPSTNNWVSTSTVSSSCPSGYHYMGGNYGGYSSYSSGYCMADSGSSTCQPVGGGATYTCPGYTVATTTAATYPFTFSASKKTCLNYQECFDYCKTTPGSGTGDPSTCDSYFPGATAYVSPVIKDNTPPYLEYSKSFPKSGEANIPIASKMHIEFNEPIDESVFAQGTFFTLQEGIATTFFGSLLQNSRKFLAQLVGQSDAVTGKTFIQGTMTFSGNGFDFAPKESLKSKTTYSWKILAGIKDKTGNKTTTDYFSTFTTAGGLFNKGVGKITGTVTDSKGSPVDNAYLNIGDSSYIFWRSTQTNASGTYSFSDVPEGKYKVSMNSPSSKTSLIAPSDVSITVEADKTTTKNLAFLASNKLIKGSIKTSDGKAITDAQISAYRQNGPGWTQTESNAQGEFAMTVSGGSWQLSAWPRNYEKASWTYDNQPVTVTFADDSADETKSVEMAMKVQNSTVIGKVAYEDGRIPGTYDVSINISSLGRSFPVGQLSSDGSFSVKVTAGVYEVSVWASDQSIKVPPQTITVLENDTKNIGTIKLAKAVEKIVAKVVNSDGKAIPSVWVSAYQTAENSYGSGGYGGYVGGYGGGYANAKTDDSGLVTLSVSPGKWNVQTYGDSTSNYTNVNSPLVVTVGEKETKTVTIKISTIDSTITGFVKDESGVVVDDFYGYVYAAEDSSSAVASSAYGGGGNGGSVSRGTFSFKAAAGTYKLKLNSSQNAVWTSDKTVTVTVGKGETSSVNITVKKNNSYIAGKLTDSRGVAITGVSARVFATGEGGAWQESYVDSATGEYSIKVTSGTWFLGASLYNYGYYGSSGSAKYSYSGDEIKIAVGDGKTVKQDIALTVVDATIKGIVKKADGKPMPYAWVSVDTKSSDTKEAIIDSRKYSSSQGSQTDKDGAFSVTVAAGTYYARVYAPPTSGVINPKEEKIVIGSAETKIIALDFRKADIAITGTTIVENTAREAFVFGWSENGGYIETRSGADGAYTLKVGTNETWRIAAKSNYQNTYYKSYEVSIKTGDTGTIKQDLTLASEKILSPSVTKSIESDKPSVITTTDGAKITMPANSVGSTGQSTVTVSPTAELPEQGTSKVVGTGYDVNVYDSVGKEVTKLNTEITINIPYDPEELKNLGIAPKDLKVAYYDETTATWMELTASAVNETEHTVTAVVSHLTRFALVAAADTIPPMAPSKVEVKALGSGKIKLTWINPEKDFKHTKVYRAEKEGELGTLRAAEIKEKEFTDDEGLKDGVLYYYTARAVDPAGNESQNTEQTKIKASGTSVKTSTLLKTEKKTIEQKLITTTATTTATSAKSITKNLNVGAKGNDVKLMQNVLINEGLLPTGSADGYFGSSTKQAVIKFQEKYASDILKPAGLTKGNGTVGTGTRKKMNQLIK